LTRRAGPPSARWLVASCGGSTRPPARPRRYAATAGTLLAALAVVPGLLPFVGLLFGIPAFRVNRRVTGWPNKASRRGLGMCVVRTVVVTVASQVPLR
jgi:hypothetical protein